ncbi:MAG: cbb3-type cytochrome oxidase assembly protein [Anaerolineae bacterium]|nr:cbb3-type cytochrome oxidase assembly protein [Anaerolineae bacterium]
MPIGLWTVVAWMAFVILTAIASIIWGWRTGQFKNIEEPKYRMLEDREPEPWDEKQTAENRG